MANKTKTFIGAAEQLGFELGYISGEHWIKGTVTKVGGGDGGRPTKTQFRICVYEYVRRRGRPLAEGQTTDVIAVKSELAYRKLEVDGLELRRRDAVTRVIRALGGRAYTFGDRDFDNKVRVRATDLCAARSYLTLERQREIAQFLSFHRDALINARKIVIDRLEPDTGTMVHAVRNMIRLAEHLSVDRA